jgi:phosphoribosylformylglycinamidine (FGAM) synthase-like amidotransferase family enzyme
MHLEQLSAKMESENKERQRQLLNNARSQVICQDTLVQVTNFEDLFESVMEEAKTMAEEFCG